MSEPSAMPPATILVVDDEPVVRQLTQRLLTVAGYRAFEATHGAEALDVMLNFTGRVDLVLTDIMMPEMDGVELVHELLQRWPDQRVLLMSAKSAPAVAHPHVADGQLPFLPKPFTAQELLAKVEETMQRSPSGGGRRTP